MAHYSCLDGNKRRTTEVIATQMVLLGSRGQSEDTDTPRMDTATRTNPDQEDSFDDLGITDSDIPF